MTKALPVIGKRSKYRHIMDMYPGQFIPNGHRLKEHRLGHYLNNNTDSDRSNQLDRYRALYIINNYENINKSLK